VKDLRAAAKDLAGSDAPAPEPGGLLASVGQALGLIGRKTPEVLPVPRTRPGIAINNG
jgi:hypothetical protein